LPNAHGGFTVAVPIGQAPAASQEASDEHCNTDCGG
jgi:hypothetical protein